ncbi:SH3 domain-containing protein [Actinokineospora soli]
MRRDIVRLLITAPFLVGGLVMASPAGATPDKTGDQLSPMHASCGTSGPNLENRVEADAPAGGAANQRSGSSTSCSAPGALQPTDDALYYCYTVGNDGYTWTYLRNLRTGVRGWVRDDLLDLNADGQTRGSLSYCGF